MLVTGNMQKGTPKIDTQGKDCDQHQCLTFCIAHLRMMARAMLKRPSELLTLYIYFR